MTITIDYEVAKLITTCDQVSPGLLALATRVIETKKPMTFEAGSFYELEKKALEYVG